MNDVIPDSVIQAPAESAVRAAGHIMHLVAKREHFNEALEAVAQASGARTLRVWWRVRAGFPVRPWVTVGADELSPDTTLTVDGDWAPVWSDEKRFVIGEHLELPQGAAAESERATEVWGLVPSGTRARGATVITWDPPGSPLSPVDRDLLRVALSAFAAQVWWRERWAQRKLERQLLDESGRLLAESFDRNDVLERIFGLLGNVVAYDAGGIFLIHPDEGEVEHITQVGYDEGLLDRLHLKIGQGLVGHVANTGETVNIGDVSADPRYVRARGSTTSALVVPVEVRGKRLGVLNLECDQMNAYDDNDKWVVQAFAHQVAVALDRVELFSKQMEVQRLDEQMAVARTIQRSFLPQKPPRVPGYDIFGVNYPSEAVGGDYFDFVPIVDGQWGVAIADVSGKGIPGALVMAGFRASMIAEIRNNYAIRTIFRKVNNVLYEMTPRDMFVTAFYGVLDARNRVFTFSNAGHNPPLLFRTGHGVERLGDGGPLVGVVPEATYEERPTWITPGDLLLLYTDGVTEAMRPGGEEFGEERLIDLIWEVKHRSSEEICAEVDRAVREFSGRGRRSDDLTMIAIKVLEDD